MKKTILFLVMAVALTTSTLFAQVPSYVPSNGLVGYWPFNGNANDESGNGNSGTVNGATLTTDRFGNSDRAYSFDGVNDFIQTSFNGITGSSSRTIALWYYTNNFGPSQTLLSYGLDDIPSNYINLWTSSTCTGIGLDISYSYKDYSNSVSLGQWNHYILVIDNLNGTTLNDAKIYKNGVLINTLCNSMGLNTQINTLQQFSMTFGKYHAQSIDYLNGKLDDIGVWNRALTQQEITTMYNSVELPTYSDTCNNVSGSLTQGLVGYWPFCGNANDDSGNGNNGTVNGAALSTDRFGNENSSYSFDGVNDFINVPHSTSQEIFGSQQASTFSFWYYGYINQPAEIISKGFHSVNVPSYGNKYLAITNDAISNQYTLYDFSTLNSVRSPNGYVIPNQWYHFVFVRDANIKVYVNGIEVSTDPNNAGWSTDYNLVLNNTNMTFGCRNNKDDNNIPFYNLFYNGKLDDIGIWNRALSATEINQLYNQNQCFTNTTVTDTLIINVGQLSYTNPIAYANNIIIAPNPASSQININFNNITNLNGGTLKIINSLGQEVATTPITTSGTNSTMQLATWGGTGMYFVQIINPQGQIVDIKKIILQ